MYPELGCTGTPKQPSGQGPYSETVRGYMAKVERQADASVPRGQTADACATSATGSGWRARPRIALLSNPKSTGNLAQQPMIREFCAEHPYLFHYEGEHASQSGEAMKSIARVRPRAVVINGGDCTLQAALT